MTMRAPLVSLLLLGLAAAGRAQTEAPILDAEPAATAEVTRTRKPYLVVRVGNPSPVVPVNWPASGAPSIPTATIISQINPSVPASVSNACSAAGGSVAWTVAPDSFRLRQASFKVEATVSAWKYSLKSANAVPRAGAVPVPYILTAQCTKTGAVSGQPKSKRGSLIISLTVDPCVACLKGCSVSNGQASCTAWAGHCPPSWPSGFSAAGWSVNMHFTPLNGQSLCKNSAFGAATKNVFKNTADLLTQMFYASGKAAVNRYGAQPPASVQPAGASPVCLDPSDTGKPYGVAQVFLDSTPSKDGTLERFKSDLTKNWMMRNACPSVFPSNMDPDIQKVLQTWCATLGAPGNPIEWAGVCTRDSDPNGSYQVDGPIEKACFPGDALVTRVDPATGEALGRARMDELRIGDAVACVKPAAMRGPGLFRDDEQAYVPGACLVFNYHDADPASTLEYVALHYTDATGRPSKLRATREHLVYLYGGPAALPAASAAGAEPHTGGAEALPPGGFARRADMVRPGDVLAVSAGGAGAEARRFYSARVERVTRERHAGAYAPLLTDAGLPVVDGAVAFAWAHLPEHDPHPAQNLGEFYRHIRLIRDFNDSLASGCAGAECPCLDAPDERARRCTRLGDRLADLPAGLSDFARRTVAVWERASAQGRTFWDYENGVRLGRFWESSKVTQLIAVDLLRLRPHTFAMRATDFLMRRAPRAGSALAAGAAPPAGAGAGGSPYGGQTLAELEAGEVARAEPAVASS